MKISRTPTLAAPLLPLDQETRVVIDTETAARHLNRRPRTLRAWGRQQEGSPINPLRIHGRLGWPVAGIRRLLIGGS